MNVSSGNLIRAHRTWWQRIRLQLGVGYVGAVLLPYMFRLHIDQKSSDFSALNNSLFVSLGVLSAGYYVFRMLTHLPGTRAYLNILPTFAATYGIGLLLIFATHMKYSISLYAAAFLLSVLWYHIVLFKIRRLDRPCIGIVPCGDVDRLLHIPRVRWSILSDPYGHGPHCDAIAADLRVDMPEEWDRFLADRALAGCLVMHVKQLEETLTGRVSIEHLSENNLGSLAPGLLYAKLRRIAEMGLCLVVIPLLLPFMLVVAAVIRLESDGPALFCQERMGYRGQTFRMYKFRTMQHVEPPADRLEAAMTKDGDQRVTRVGKYLRRFRIDELPQILNIIKGDMSWIGPRPEAELLSLWYEVQLPFYRYRHIVRPGITGWAQVNQGHVCDVSDVHCKLQYDFYYIKNFSFWLDILIIAKTFKTVLNGFGVR